MNEIEIAIIGDHFMKPEIFEKELRKQCSHPLKMRKKTLPWPDLPMEHGYQTGSLSGLKEYQGDPEEITEFIGKAEILVNHLAPITEEMLARLPQLKLIAVSRGGPTNIDIQACKAKGIQLENVPGRNASAVAEFTIGAILMETRNIRRGHETLRKGEWDGSLYRYDVTGHELCDLTVGLIGYGEIGTKVVRLLKPFGCKILVHDPYKTLNPQDESHGVRQVSLEELLKTSDIVSLHPRVNEETTKMINAKTISWMKDGVYLINTARGPLMDYSAVYEALISDKIRGAMLETFDLEPPNPENPLLRLPNVSLTPHIAGASTKTVHYAAEECIKKVNNYLNLNF